MLNKLRRRVCVSIYAILVSVFLFGLLVMAYPIVGSIDYQWGIVSDYPQIPEPAYEVEVKELEVVDRGARSTSRSSMVSYHLFLRNVDEADEKRYDMTVELEQFMSVPNGSRFYYYRYSEKPAQNFAQRLKEQFSWPWVRILSAVLAMVSLCSLAILIPSAIRYKKEREAVIEAEKDLPYWERSYHY